MAKTRKAGAANEVEGNGKKKGKKKNKGSEQSTTSSPGGRRAKTQRYIAREDERRERKIRRVFRHNGPEAAKALCQGPKSKTYLNHLLEERAARPKQERRAVPKVRPARPKPIHIGRGGWGTDEHQLGWGKQFPLLPPVTFELRPIVLEAFRTDDSVRVGLKDIRELLEARVPERQAADKVRADARKKQLTGVKKWERRLADRLRRFLTKDRSNPVQPKTEPVFQPLSAEERLRLFYGEQVAVM